MQLSTTTLATAAGIALLALPAAAQHTTFSPSISMGLEYDDDLGKAGVNDTSDTAARVAVDLPVTREWARKTLSFSYQPSFYRQNDEESLDRDEHRLRFRFGGEPTPRSTYGFSAGFSRSQEQSELGVFDPDAGLSDADLFQTQRTDRDALNAGFSFRHTASERWSWGVGLGWSDRTFDRIDDFDDTAPGSEVEDRTSLNGSFRFDRTLDRRTSVGIRVSQAHYDLDRSGTEDSTSLDFTYRRTLGPKSELGFEVGGYYSSGEASDGIDDDDERSGVDGRVNYRRSYRNFDMGIDATHRPSSGGDLSGTSTDTRVGMVFSGPVNRDWSWRVSPRYGVRDPSDDTESNRRTATVSSGMVRRVSGAFGIGFNAQWVDQSNDDQSSYSVGASIVVYPMGRQAAGGPS